MDALGNAHARPERHVRGRARRGSNARWFDHNGTAYVPRFYGQDTLASSGGEFTLTDTLGNVSKFYDFSASPAVLQGRLKSFTSAGGALVDTTTLSYTTSGGAITGVTTSRTTGGVTEAFVYTYTSGRITLVQQQRGGTTSRQTVYQYYSSGAGHGNAGDLKFAIVQDGSGTEIDRTDYRYYVSGDANIADGYVGGLKYELTSDSYARLMSTLSSGADPDTAADTAVGPYADRYMEYDTQRRVKTAAVQGSGCSCTGVDGVGTYTYAYRTNPVPAAAGDYNAWKFRTTETLPDGNQNVIYTNAAGEVMLKVFKDTTASQSWLWFTKYDGAGRPVLQAGPSALTGFDESKADLLNNGCRLVEQRVPTC